MGELYELAQRLPAAIADADARGDRYAAFGMRSGVLGLAWLAQDQPRQGLAYLDESIREWPTRTFLLQHYLHLIAAVNAELYLGDVWAAWRRVQNAWPGLRSALFLAMESPRVELRNLRARAALAAAAAVDLPVAAATPDAAWPRQRLLRQAMNDARRLDRDTSIASSAGFAALIRAGVARIEGRHDEAQRFYTTAASRFERVEMRLYRFAALRRRGELIGGSQGAWLREQSEQWMQKQGVLDRELMTRTLAPAN
jgi:hypothetical protein